MSDAQDHQGPSVPNPEDGAEYTPSPPEGTDTPALGAAPDAEALQRERDEYRDLLLRQTAEFDNYRKRTERERREAGDRAVGDFILELLPVIDDLERATTTEAGAAGVDAYRDGITLIGRRLADLLARRGVSVIDPLGDDFDPHVHEAVVREAAAGRRDGEVVEVLGRGYRLGDRLLRPAMVKVATS